MPIDDTAPDTDTAPETKATDYGPEELDRLVHVSIHPSNSNIPGLRALNARSYRLDKSALLSALVIAIVIASVSGVPTMSNQFNLEVAAAALLGYVFILLLRRRSVPRLSEEATARLAWKPDERFRLRLIAGRRGAGAFLNLVDEAFEPRIYRLFNSPARFTRSRRLAIVGIGIFVFAGLLLCARWSIYAVHPWLLFFLIGGIAALAEVALGALWPTYLRVAPGRLDILAFGLLGRGHCQTMSFDLRTARVLVNIVNDEVLFERVGHAPTVIYIPGVYRRLEFARSVLDGARSSAPTPPLPHDALVG